MTDETSEKESEKKRSELTLTEAAALMGRSVRQVRYLIKQGKVPAMKRAGIWWLNSTTLPMTAGQKAARISKAEDLKQEIHSALGPHLSGSKNAVFGVSSLRAFSVGQELMAACRALPEPVPEAVESFMRSLVSVGQGCHRFFARDKGTAYKSAREEAAKTVVLLHLSAHDAAKSLAGRIEAEFLPSVSGLIRRSDREGGTM